MVYDFMHGWGRYDDDDGTELYSDGDLRFGITYAEGMIEEGRVVEPFHGYHLRDFIVWARKALERSRNELRHGTGEQVLRLW
jgi:hypothetical protein